MAKACLETRIGWLSSAGRCLETFLHFHVHSTMSSAWWALILNSVSDEFFLQDNVNEEEMDLSYLAGCKEAKIIHRTSSLDNSIQTPVWGVYILE